MVSCRKATQLLSQQMDDPLSAWEKIQLYSHLLVCWCCRRFQRHMLILREAIRELAHETIAFERYEELELPGLSPESRKRILTLLRNKSK
jgi:predicted anti-sigma-YlaC factor YlaD